MGEPGVVGRVPGPPRVGQQEVVTQSPLALVGKLPGKLKTWTRSIPFPMSPKPGDLALTEHEALGPEDCLDARPRGAWQMVVQTLFIFQNSIFTSVLPLNFPAAL